MYVSYTYIYTSSSHVISCDHEATTLQVYDIRHPKKHEEHVWYSAAGQDQVHVGSSGLQHQTTPVFQ